MPRLQFGLSLPPNADRVDAIRDLTTYIDQAGLDLLAIQDHPYLPDFLDTMSLVATLLSQTSSLRIYPSVASLPLRPPAILAKAAASLDIISNGRFELGIGTGAYLEGIVAIGGARHQPGEAIQGLEEAIEVIRAVWSGKSGISFRGDYYTLSGLRSGPVPPHPIGIWVGGSGKRMLHLIGRLADGWVAPLVLYLPYERWDWAQQQIDQSARDAGRDPTAIIRVADLMGTITDQGDGGRPTGSAPLRGNSRFWADFLADTAQQHRFDTFVFWPEQPFDRKQAERFVQDVVPAVRERVEAGRPAD